ncbi:MAG: Fic family protein [Myxococcota bacterium]|jgi:Fic family protein|nr:Fic family protein [Myxococcota bacterium]MEC9440375.1 Fic family protein [Myxococcota bacterium]
MNLAYLEIDYHRSAYDSMPEQLRAAFMDRLVISWLYHEHALEGVVLEEEDIWRALNNQPCRSYCDRQIHKQIRRMYALFHQILEEAGSQEPITLEWLKDTHTALCDASDEAAGRYRKRDTSPGVYNLDVVPSNSISYYFRKFIDIYNEELIGSHPVRAAAIAHWEFMKVFPFDERTGLVGRLMLNAILIRNDYPPAIIHANDRHTYFAALSGHRTDVIPTVVEAVSATIEAVETFSHRFNATISHRVAL